MFVCLFVCLRYVLYNICIYKSFISNICELDLALNKPYGLICHKTQTNNQPTNLSGLIFSAYLHLCIFLSLYPICLLSSRLILHLYIQEQTFPTSGFSATHRVDIKILPDCKSLGDPKKCDDKIEPLLSRGATFI